jgi:hypothetical protein
VRSIQEAKYIQVIWKDQTAARKIVASHDSLRLNPINENTVEVEVVCYSRIDDGSAGQLAIRLGSQAVDVPRVELGNSASMDLLPVTDPVTGLRWWVEGKTWDKRRGRWLSDIYRGVGEVWLRVGVQFCRVKISTSTFTHQQLERYLIDFHTDFWELILDDSSYISAAARRSLQKLLDAATLHAITRFIECVELILKNPKVELREVQRLTPRKDVRPVPRTFMEMSTRGSTRTLTSRAYHESLDLPENRYAHYALRKVYQITKAMCAVVANQARSLERNLKAHRHRLSNFSDVKVINKEAVMHDLLDKEQAILELENRMSAQNSHFAQLVSLNSEVGQREFSGRRIPCLRVLLSDRACKIPGNPFFAKIRSSETKPWYEFTDGGYATVELGMFRDQVGPGYEYEISGEIDYTTIPGANRTRHHFELLAVSEFRLVRSQKHESLKQRLSAAQRQIRELESSGWQRPLTWDEAEQQKREVASIERIIGLFMSKQENLAFLSRELAPKLPWLRAALKVFEREKIKLDSRFPNSMTYVQNPAYQGVHGAFSKIKECSGINDEEILLAMDRIEEIGIVNVAMLYERWCLLQIIKILNRFRYRPEQGWKRKLITQVLDHGRNVAIDFENSGLRRQLTLRYEMELENGKRPDFVLDVSANCSGGTVSTRKRFVMDSKFYQDINSERHGGLRRVIDELYNTKDYAEGGRNTVFIIHPSSRATPSRATPQEWSRDNYYGEICLFDWDNSLPNHRYGGIFLSPIADGDYLDSLQRAIGMFFQYGMENNDTTTGEQGALPENGVFCLVCGSSEVSYRQSPRNSKAWWVTCNDCNHFTTYNYCGVCENRLIKNGEYWTYHAMEPLNPTNIKCPSCGDLL